MVNSINVEGLREFDAASYLDSEAAIAAYLTDILAANDAALRRAALDDIARARGIAIRVGQDSDSRTTGR